VTGGSWRGQHRSRTAGVWVGRSSRVREEGRDRMTGGLAGLMEMDWTFLSRRVTQPHL